MKAKCPRCGWTTRELGEDEVELVQQGRLRCSGKCQGSSIPNQPQTFPPKLKLEQEEAK